MGLYAINVNIYIMFIQRDIYNLNNIAAVATMISVIVAVTIYWV